MKKKMGQTMSRQFFLLAAIFSILVLGGLTAHAATYQVKQDGSGDFTGIGAAIAATIEGDEIVVGPGIYYESDMNFLGKNLILRSENGARHTIIDCNNVGRAFTFSGSVYANTVIDGFTFQHGRTGWNGGAIYLNGANLTIKNSIFQFNNTKFFPEELYNGGALYISGGTPFISNCLFLKNETNQYGGALDITAGATPTITNCTFAYNSAGTSGGAISQNASVAVSNSIFWGNEAPTGSQINNSGSLIITNSDLLGGIAAISGNPVTDNGGNIDADPLFIGFDNFHLRSGSPCIDTGSNTAVNDPGLTVTLDSINGTARIEDGDSDGSATADMGAYEYHEVVVATGEDLQTALTNAKNGDTILVDPDIYTPPANGFDLLGKAVHLLAKDGPEATIIDGYYSDHLEKGLIVDSVDQNTFIEGFTIRNCVNGVIVINGNPSIKNCVFISNNNLLVLGNGAAINFSITSAPSGIPAHVNQCRFFNNVANLGGAIYINGESNVEISESLFRGNGATWGGALSGHFGGISSWLKLQDTRFIQNNALADGGAVNIDNTNSSFINTVFQQNNAMFGSGGAAVLAFPSGIRDSNFNFCTFHGNHAGTDGDLITTSGTHNLIINNSILWGSGNASAKLIVSADTLTVKQSDIEGGLAQIQSAVYGVEHGLDVIDIDPEFVFDDNYHLMPDSPCIDAAGAIDPSWLTWDVDGSVRPLDGDSDSIIIADMGAHEFNPAVAEMAVSPDFLSYFHRQGNLSPDYQTISIRNAGTVPLQWQVNASEAWLTAEPQESISGLTSGEAADVKVFIKPAELELLVPGDYQAQLDFIDSADNRILQTVMVYLTVGRTLRVSGATGDFSTIQSAIDEAHNGDVISVGPGIYSEGTIRFYGKAITIRSESGPEDTIIVSSGANCFVFDHGEGRSAVLDGFTMQNANDSAIQIKGASPTIVNCIFRYNSSEYGGAVFIDGDSSYIANCQFKDNTATLYGGAVYIAVKSNNIIENCSFTNNLAQNGGGIFIQGLLGTGQNIVRGCKFTGNSATNPADLANHGVGGGGVYILASVADSIQACTFDFNTAIHDSGGAVFIANSSTIIANSVFEDNQAEGYYGGAILVYGAYSDVQILNNTIVNNYSTYEGAAISTRGELIEGDRSGGKVTILNTIFYHNLITNGLLTHADIYNYSNEYDVILTNSYIADNTPYDASNISSGTPGFANFSYWGAHGSDPGDTNTNNYQLAQGSQLIDKGTEIYWLYSDIRSSLRPIDGNDSFTFDIGAYEYGGSYGSSTELDMVVQPFKELGFKSSVILIGHEYEIEWKDKNPFPAEDDRVFNAGEYEVMLALVNDSGLRIDLLEKPQVMQISQIGYSIPVTFHAEQIGNWRIRLELANDPNQFVLSEEPVDIEFKHVETRYLGEQIIAPEGVLADQKPDIDIEEAFYWSEGSNRLFAVKPGTVVITWYVDVERTQPVLMVVHIEKPPSPQIHIANIQPVELLPAGSPFDSVRLLYTGSGANTSANSFSAVNEGYSVLFYKDEQAQVITDRERFEVVRTLTWDHNLLEAGHITFPVETPWDIGREITDVEHDGDCGAGYVYFDKGWYDGYGENKAYDRENRQGQIFAVNEDLTGLIVSDESARDDLVAVWYKKSESTRVCWPEKSVRYNPVWPADVKKIVIASGLGTGPLTPDPYGLQEDMAIYNQPDPNILGYNPNDEHAAFFTAQSSQYLAAFALRNDLGTSSTSDPYVLLKYKDPGQNNSWNFEVFGVVDQSGAYVRDTGVISGPVNLAADLPVPDRRYVINTSAALVEYTGEHRPEGYYLDFEGKLVDAKNKSNCYQRNGAAIESLADCSTVPVYYLDDNGVLSEKTGSETDVYSLDEQGVLVENETYHRFHYSKTAGNEINPFYPLNQMAFGPCDNSYTLQDKWVLKDKDQKFFAKAGGIDGGTMDVGVRYYYRLLSDFFFDSNGDRLHDTEAPPGTCVAWMDNLSDTPKTTVFAVHWPDVFPTLFVGETLTEAKTQEGDSVGLPNIADQCIVRVLFDQPVENTTTPPDFGLHSVNLIDPIKEFAVSYDLSNPEDESNPEDDLPQTLKPRKDLSTGRWVFTAIPYHIQSRLTYDEVTKELKLKGLYSKVTGEPMLLLNSLTVREIAEIEFVFTDAGQSVDEPFMAKVGTLSGLGKDELIYPGSYPELKFAEMKALTAGDARGTGYVTLSFNNDADCAAPTMLSVIRVGCDLYRGDVKVIASENPFEEKVTLRHNGDFGGNSDDYSFEWQYLVADIPGIPEGPGTAGENWQEDYKPQPEYLGLTQDGNAWFGAVDTVIQGSGQQLLPDKWFSVRYHYSPAEDCPCSTTSSEWTKPQLYEGWIKRVMKKINLFDQKMTDFHAADVNTLASMISLAGERYEGDIALSDDPEYLQSLGIIEVYETLLNRGNSLAEGVDSADINMALLFAANRLADLYMLLGNEAYGDAADPTIGFSTEDGQVGSEASSIFSFQNQVDSLLDEELTLLRGRDDAGVQPFYNRLVWNFTLGDGEVAYKENYNITDQDTDDTDGDRYPDAPDGEINELDAMVQYPLGHGDAWGHYLSAVKKYYNLLKRDNYTWIPNTEAILVAGTPVEVDYRDERKFAVAAAARARTGAEVVNLSYRSKYTEDPEGQWQGYKDIDSDRAWGVDGWSKRAGQAAFFDWVVGNSLLPAQYKSLQVVVQSDGQTVFDISATGYQSTADQGITAVVNSVPVGPEGYTLAGAVVTFTAGLAVDDIVIFQAVPKSEMQRVDRTTVLELQEITSRLNEIQAKVDSANIGLNPLGLAKDVVPFDIDPARIASGETHFEQIYGRSVEAMNNAIAVFNHANRNTSLLRKQQDSLADFQRNIDNMEADYNNRLIEMFGYPYPDDCGPGKTYTTAYCSTGPDLYHYMYTDVSELMGVEAPKTFDFEVVMEDLEVDVNGALSSTPNLITFHMATDSRFGLIKPDDWLGRRKAPGEVQFALSELLQTRGRFEKAIAEYDNMLDYIWQKKELIDALYGFQDEEMRILIATKDRQETENLSIWFDRNTELESRRLARIHTLIGDAYATMLPTSTGFSNDVTSAVRGATKASFAAQTEFALSDADEGTMSQLSHQQAKELVSLESNISITAARNDFTVKQQVLELENLIRSEALLRLELYNLEESLKQSVARYLAALAKGERLFSDRLRFRKQTAAQVQDYRYKDMAFRIFRNDALQKYRAQFDLASRYVYLAAKAYDYETTLLDSDSRAGETFLTSIVKQRTIGLIESGLPLTGSGLADPMKRMYQNFQVLKPQLGFNNPQIETNRFSLRQELMRIKMDSGSNETWRNGLKSYMVPDLWDVPEFRRYCRPFAPEGLPQPGLVIPFTTTVTPGLNFFKWPLGGGDSYYSSTNFATKIRSVGVWFSNYNTVGLAQTPRIYLIPAGEDVLRTPSSSFENIRTWQVVDQKLPQPFPIDSTELENNPDWIPAVDSIFDEMFEIRKHSDFRAYHDSGYINQSEMQYDSRLIGRSVWNSRWLLIIPGQSLLFDPMEGLETFIEGPVILGSDERTGNGILDIKLFFETYGYSGN